LADTPLAQSFDRAAREYERGRIDWPAEAVERAALELGLGPDATVLDLAAGTGKLTRVLVPWFARVVAVEPLDGMRALLEELVPEAEAFAGTAESMPLPDGSVDAVFCAEAFHWFDGPRALAEIARVLRPRGGLVVIFSFALGPTAPPVPDAVRDRLNALRTERKSPRETPDSGLWREAFAASPFEELRDFAVPFEYVNDREGLLALFASQSWIGALPEPERDALLREIAPLVADAEYRRPFRADVAWTRLDA
jgi:ubiquinone/menaquinone biosynthesis C-methylase UbiE